MSTFFAFTLLVLSTVCYTAQGAASLSYECNFPDTTLCGWETETKPSGLKWSHYAKKGTPPKEKPESTADTFAKLSSSSFTKGESVRFTSPFVEMSYERQCLKFRLWMRVFDAPKLIVSVQNTSGVEHVLLRYRASTQGKWVPISLNMRNAARFKIVLEGESVGVNNDLAVTHVTVNAGPCAVDTATAGVIQGFVIDTSKTSQAATIWPVRTAIPYAIDSAFGSLYIQRINEAITQINDRTLTCLQLKPRKVADNDYIYLKYDQTEECLVDWNGFRKSIGAHIIRINPLQCDMHNPGDLMHLILKALGMMHPHDAPNRDKYVTVHYGAIKSWAVDRFTLADSPANPGTTMDMGYDYYSIMHYAENAFGKYASSKTITPNSSWQGSHGFTIGQRIGFSRQDLIQLYLLYGCGLGKVPPLTVVCENGGNPVGYDFCNCLANPKYEGPRCETPVCSKVCDHGTCVKSGSLNVCACNRGYRGEQCNLFKCTHTCGRGECTGPETCTCNAGWTDSVGSSTHVFPDGFSPPEKVPYNGVCLYPKCERPCMNGGTCVNPNMCSCPNGFLGPTCSLVECEPHCVAKQGRCTATNVCTCEPGFTGITCEIAMYNSCTKADSCSVANSYCASWPSCHEVDEHGICLCKTGYLPKVENGPPVVRKCQPKIDYGGACDSEGHICEGGASCLDYSCQCEYRAGWKWDVTQRKCVKTLQTGLHNTNCNFNDQCFGDMLCQDPGTGARCNCANPSYEVPKADRKSCEFLGVLDAACSTEEKKTPQGYLLPLTHQCGRIGGASAGCIDSKCQCTAGSRQILVWLSEEMFRQGIQTKICLASEIEVLTDKGKDCNPDYTIANPKICSTAFICRMCPTTHTYRCLVELTMAVISTSHGAKQFNMITMLLTIVANLSI